MTSIPLVPEEGAPVGLVVATGRAAETPARIWAYLWSADEDDRHEPPHRRVPVFPVR
jgi:hypothetical protein